MPTWRLQFFDRKCCYLTVVLGQLVDDINRFCVFPDPRKKSRTLQEVEDEEAEAPQEKIKSTEYEEKVSPTHVVRLFTALGGGTGKTGNEEPCNLQVACRCHLKLNAFLILTRPQVSSPKDHQIESIVRRYW